MRVLVTGSNGQLGSDLVEVLSSSAAKASGCQVFGVTHRKLEISDPDSIKRQMDEIRPTHLINTAAFHDVQKCELEPERAFTVNTLGAKNVALACKASGAALLHISTDYVFGHDNKSQYCESDLPGPVNLYGATKLAGEHMIRLTLPRHFIVRTSGLYGSHPCRGKSGRNFAESMLYQAAAGREISVVRDQFVAPTYTVDLAKQILRLLGSAAYGTYHASSHGKCSWYEFALRIFALSRCQPKIQATDTDSFSGGVARPRSSVLDNRALRRAGMDLMRPWEDALGDYLRARAQRKQDGQKSVAPLATGGG